MKQVSWRCDVDKVYISLNGLDLGYLTETNQGFEFVAYENNIELAEKENLIVMNMFKVNKCGKKTYSAIPEPFSRFIVSEARHDLIEKANIKIEDNQFARLFKLAGLNMVQINFKIHQ